MHQKLEVPKNWKRIFFIVPPNHLSVKSDSLDRVWDYPGVKSAEGKCWRDYHRAWNRFFVGSWIITAGLCTPICIIQLNRAYLRTEAIWPSEAKTVSCEPLWRLFTIPFHNSYGNIQVADWLSWASDLFPCHHLSFTPTSRVQKYPLLGMGRLVFECLSLWLTCAWSVFCCAEAGRSVWVYA